MAHSVEHWQGDQLIGGLYCVALGKMVYGESMFDTQTDASAYTTLHERGWRTLLNTGKATSSSVACIVWPWATPRPTRPGRRPARSACRSSSNPRTATRARA
nr:hypothetical protein [Mycobacterium tuberculosis]